MNFELWLDYLSIVLMLIKKELVLVCYSSSFIIKISNLLLKSKSYYLITKSIKSELELHSEKQITADIMF